MVICMCYKGMKCYIYNKKRLPYSLVIFQYHYSGSVAFVVSCMFFFFSILLASVSAEEIIPDGIAMIPNPIIKIMNVSDNICRPGKRTMVIVGQ